MTAVRISVWSGPRNISTALMYSFASRSDTTVLDEPLYAHYLAVTDVNHPGREEVLAAQDQDAAKVINNVILKDYDSDVLFIKNMAHHLVDMEERFLGSLKNVFLIRNPADVITSLIKNLPDPVMRDTGFQREYELHNQLKGIGAYPLVIDADELLKDPKKILKVLCQKVGIRFEPAMLKWEKGAIPEDGIWAKYWYKNVHNSVGFAPYKLKHEQVPDHLLPLLEECKFYYDKLFAVAIKA